MIQMTRGDDRWLRCDVETEDGDPYPWADAAVWLTAKKSRGDADGDAVIALSSPSADVDLSTDGVARFRIHAAATKDLENRDQTLYFDVQIRSAAGNIYTVEEAEMLVKAEITVAA